MLGLPLLQKQTEVLESRMMRKQEEGRKGKPEAEYEGEKVLMRFFHVKFIYKKCSVREVERMSELLVRRGRS